MKKIWNIAVLLIFVNFLALPSIASIFNFELNSTNMIVSEEEHHSNTSITVYEKTLPDVLDVNKFLKFAQPVENINKFIFKNDNFTLNNFLSVFSPPPEFS